MPITPPKPKQGDYKQAPAGNHLAMCYAVLDLGSHDDVYDGKPKVNRKLMLRWELADEMMDDGRPFSLSRTFNFSTHENAGLRKFLSPWVGPFTDESAQAFDYETLAPRPCMLTVVHNKSGDKVYANVEAASPLPKRIAAPEQVNPTVTYSVDDGPPPADFPDWLREKILTCHEMRGQHEKSGKPASDRIPPAATPASREPGSDDDIDEIAF